MTYPPSAWPEPAGTATVAWQALIGDQAYTFVALRIHGAGWFLTGQTTWPLSWDALCLYLPPIHGCFLQLGVVGQIDPYPPHPASQGAHR